MSLGRRDVRIVELHGSARKRSVRISSLTVEPVPRAEARDYEIGVIVRRQLQFDVWLLAGVSCANRIGGGLRGFKRLGYRQSDVLAVIANDVVVEWRPALFTDA